jgi:5'-deoxynucleotidase YfbR-like HD superfamily hydrolase
MEIVARDVVARITPVALAERLGNICRYAGAVTRWYSVLQHSLLVYRLAQEEYPQHLHVQYVALLHDAPEAWTGDITRPFKKFLSDHVPQYNNIENDMLRTVLGTFVPRFAPYFDENTFAIMVRVKRLDKLAACAEISSGIACLDDAGEENTHVPECFRTVDKPSAMRILRRIMQCDRQTCVDTFVEELSSMVQKFGNYTLKEC